MNCVITTRHLLTSIDCIWVVYFGKTILHWLFLHKQTDFGLTPLDSQKLDFYKKKKNSSVAARIRCIFYWFQWVLTTCVQLHSECSFDVGRPSLEIYFYLLGFILLLILHFFFQKNTMNNSFRDKRNLNCYPFISVFNE